MLDIIYKVWDTLLPFLYDIGVYVGFFSILTIFLILAIIFAKKLYAWILYLAGAGITLLALLGNHKAYISQGYNAAEIMRPYWDIYFSLLLIAGTIILIRYSTLKDK